MSYLYLASPYSHADPEQRHFRYRLAVQAAARLMSKGEVVYSPIAHSHPIEEVLSNPTNHEFWMRQCIPMLRHASKLVVLRLPDWDMSRGVAQEIHIAEEIGLPVEYMDI